MKRLLIVVLALALIIPLTAGVMARESRVDLTSTAEGRQFIQQAAARFAAAGHATNPADLVAMRYPDGSTVIGPRGLSVSDLRATGQGWRVAVPAGEPAPVLLGGPPPQTSAAPYWAPAGDGCFASLFRGSAHFDTCYGIYKMANDGSSTYDYWRVDFNGTMFAEGTKLKWGWLAADQDAGPVQSFTTNGWSPTQDTETGCQTTSVGISVLGVGASYGYTQCEEWDISKGAGSALGYFKNYWDWGARLPLLNKDRGVAMMIGTRGSPGAPTYGLSWDFAIY